MKGHDGRALAALFVGAMAIALAPIFAKLAVDRGGVGPVAAAFWRTALAVPVFLLLARGVRAGGGGTTSARSGTLLLVPGLFFAADLATWHASFEYTSVANSTLLANVAVVWVSLVGWLRLGERLDRRFLFGGIAALAGIAFLLYGSAGQEIFPGRQTLVGDGMAILTSFFYAGYLLSVKGLRKGQGTYRIMAWVTSVCAAALLPVTLAMGETLLPAGSEGWLWLVLLAAVPQCLGQGLIAWSLARLPASFASVGLLLQPVGAAVWGWSVLGQSVRSVQWAGGVLVLVGIHLARRGSRPAGG